MFNPFYLLRKASIILGVLSFAAVCIMAYDYLKEEQKTETIQIPSKEYPKVSIEFDEKLLRSYASKNQLILERTKEDLLFYGSSERPFEKIKLYFGFKSSSQIFSCFVDEKIQAHGIEMKSSLKDKEAFITLQTGDDQLQFLSAKIPLPSNLSTFEIGSVRVDPTFLSRQRFRLIGIDLFLAKHDGLGKEFYRIDLENYSLYVNEGSVLYWKDDRWINCSDAKEGCPLLQIQKIDDKLLAGILYAPDAPLSCTATLAKYPELLIPPKATHIFHYVGARNLKEWLFEVNGKKATVKEGDWWLGTEKGWQLLDSEEDIDAYVERKLTGELFIVEKAERVNGEKVLIGKAYNAARTKEFDISIPIKNKKSVAPYVPPYQGAVITKPEEIKKGYKDTRSDHDE